MSEFSQYTSKTARQVAQELKTSFERGLSSDERAARLRQHGGNELPGEAVSWQRVLVRQFRSSFVYLLLGAGLLSSLLGGVLDGAIIFLFVAINAALGFYQEYHSEQTVRLLKRYAPRTTKVRIDGRLQLIAVSKLVPGDIVELSPGDVIPADMRFVAAHNLVVDESVLTGESAPTEKSIEPTPRPTAELYEARDMGFADTTVVSGSATGVVVATGPKAVIGDVARLAGSTARESSFEKNLKRLSRFILRLVVLTIAGVFIINIVIKGSGAPALELFIFSIALVVSVIPEALPVVMTFSLSRGALRLARNKVVVKRLSAIEDLGSIEVLCTDKTGTLTENKLVVADIYGKDPDLVLRSAALASSFFSLNAKDPDAFDTAVWSRFSKSDQKALQAAVRVDEEQPFDPERKRNSVLVKYKKAEELIVRGAPEVIVPFCRALSSAERGAITVWLQQQGVMGRRVIAVAARPVGRLRQYTAAEEERELGFVGLVSFIDQLKASSIPAVKKAKRLGVAVKILTGDSPEVAGAVGRQVGLVSSAGAVITGEQLDKLSSAEEHEAVQSYAVFARVSPQQKYKIIQLLKERYEVGFLGEGINDAPALKSANIGLVVGSASDIAREAADIVLLQKSLEVIIDGIHEGREVFANTVKYIKTALSNNFGNFYTVAIVSLLIDFLPMLPLQILLVNLLSDFPMIAVATDRVDPGEVNSPKSYNLREIALLATILGITSSAFDFIFFAIFSRLGPAKLQTNWFITSILTELVFIYSIRTRFFFLRAKKPSATLLGLTLLAGIITLVIPFSGFGQSLFHFSAPTFASLLIDLIIVTLYFVATETVKLLYYHFSAAKRYE